MTREELRAISGKRNRSDEKTLFVAVLRRPKSSREPARTSPPLGVAISV
jgi:hypothetical protein